MNRNPIRRLARKRIREKSRILRLFSFYPSKWNARLRHGQAAGTARYPLHVHTCTLAAIRRGIASAFPAQAFSPCSRPTGFATLSRGFTATARGYPGKPSMVHIPERLRACRFSSGVPRQTLAAPVQKAPAGALFIHACRAAKPWRARYACMSNGRSCSSFFKYSGWCGCPCLEQAPAQHHRAP